MELPELNEELRIVVFCGGFGTRMWPMSRESLPKQFQPLLGDNSFFQKAIERVKLGFKTKNIFIAVPEFQVDFVRKQAPEISSENIIAEPERRDTLGAVGYAASFLEKHFPNSLMAIIWGADHLVEDEERFNKLIYHAAEVCQKRDVICKIDVIPTYPSTANGWVKLGKLMEKVGGFSLYEFEDFVEKPDLEKAKKLFSSQDYLINTGYFVCRTGIMLSLYEKYAPDCYFHLKKIMEAMGTKDEEIILRKEYSQIEKTSVDFGLFEKLPAHTMTVFRGDIGWYDVGTWTLLYESLARGQRQNITKGDVDFIEAQGNLVYLPKNKIASIIGLDNLVVVDTPDGLLVCDRKKTELVKKFVESLKEKNKKEYL